MRAMDLELLDRIRDILTYTYDRDLYRTDAEWIRYLENHMDAARRHIDTLTNKFRKWK